MLVSNRVNHDGEQYQMRLMAYSTNNFQMIFEERNETFHVKRLVDLKDG